MQIRDIISNVVEAFFDVNISEKKARAMSHAVIERILKAINDGERVELPGLGVMRLGYLPAMKYTLKNTRQVNRSTSIRHDVIHCASWHIVLFRSASSMQNPSRKGSLWTISARRSAGLRRPNGLTDNGQRFFLDSPDRGLCHQS